MTTLAVMSPTGGIAILIVAVVAVAMVVYFITQGNKNRMVHSADMDQIRRFRLTLSPAKVSELVGDLDAAAKAVNEKKKTDNTPEMVTSYVDDVNGRGPTLVEIQVKRA